MFKTRRGILAFIALVVLSIYCIRKYVIPHEPDYLRQQNVPASNMYTFSGLEGPTEKSVVKEKVVTTWRKYHTDNPSALCILLTDTASEWVGIAHGLTNIGVPFTITTQAQEAVLHNVVLVYPVISGKVLDRDGLQALAAVPRNGGTLIGCNVLGGGLNEVFGFDDVRQGDTRSALHLNTDKDDLMRQLFKDPAEQDIWLYDPKVYPNAVPTCGYTNAKNPWISFDDGTCALSFKDYGRGRALAFGIDLGSYFIRNMDERAFNGFRYYVNRFDGGIDVLLRLLKEIYVYSDKDAVTIGTVPFNKDFTLIITHDIDFTKSIVNTVKYAAMEQEKGVSATYFIQTKYIKDWNDDIFFNKENMKYLQQINEMGMEIGSHSVSHSRVFSKFPQGYGGEQYPAYQPFVAEKLVTNNGSVLGELRVSKFLLEQEVKGLQVRSFRPGHLQYPFSLPQSLDATGYEFSSSVTADNVQTHLPYMMMYNREFDAETNIVEIPVTVEDELGAPMMQRLDTALKLTRQLTAYGGVMNILIHTDTLGQKYAFEQNILDSCKSKAWVSTIGEFGAWWRTRNYIQVLVKNTANGGHVVTIKNDGGQPINGLCLRVPAQWKLQPADPRIEQHGNTVIINRLLKETSASFL